MFQLPPLVTKYCANCSFVFDTIKTPLTVQPQLPLEIVMQLFKRMGYVEFFKGLNRLKKYYNLTLYQSPSDPCR